MDASKVSYACVDTENVDIARIKKYCSNRAWKEIVKVINITRDIPEEFWYCNTCQTQLSNHTEGVQCDNCLEWWSHVKCIPKYRWACF